MTNTTVEEITEDYAIAINKLSDKDLWKYCRSEEMFDWLRTKLNLMRELGRREEMERIVKILKAVEFEQGSVRDGDKEKAAPVLTIWSFDDVIQSLTHNTKE